MDCHVHFLPCPKAIQEQKHFVFLYIFNFSKIVSSQCEMGLIIARKFEHKSLGHPNVGKGFNNS